MSIMNVLDKNGSRPSEADERLSELEIRAKVLQSELEGMLRQMLQGASQLQIVAGFKVYNALFAGIALKFEALQAIVEEGQELTSISPSSTTDPEQGPTIN